MISIGMTQDGLLVYEGSGRYGHPVWPSPVISRAHLIERESDWLRIPPQGTRLSLVFREDSFDPVTRVRRGRLYDGTRKQPDDWRVRPHPALGGEEERRSHRNGGEISVSLESFDAYQGFAEKPNRGRGLNIALGTSDAVSAWRIVAIERIFTGEDLLTLRARTSLGVFPDLIPGAIPAVALHRLETALAAAADAVFREGPTSIIDRCRDAAQVALAHWLANEENEDALITYEIARLCERLEAREPAKVPKLLITTARLIAQMHARGKPVEQVRRKKTAPSEGDAETVVAALGSLLREIGWSKA